MGIFYIFCTEIFNHKITKSCIQIDGDSFTIDTVDDPTNGGSVTNDDTTVTYTVSEEKCEEIAPDATYTDTVDYTIIDQDGLTSNKATITITAKCRRKPPTAVDDSEETDVDSPVVVDVLSNDSDPDDDPLIVDDIPTQPNYGTATENNDDTITYTPDDRANRKCAKIFGNSFTDSFTYRIRDTPGDELTDTATVRIKVNCIRNPPVAEDDEAMTDENTPVNIDVLVNDYDPGTTCSVFLFIVNTM